jgi:hypothetical protein
MQDNLVYVESLVPRKNAGQYMMQGDVWWRSEQEKDHHGRACDASLKGGLLLTVCIYYALRSQHSTAF